MTEKTIWVRGRPVRGAIFGLLLGLGLFLLLTKFEVIVIDTVPFVTSLAGGVVIGIVRALIGRPYRVSVESSAAPPEAAPPA